MTTPSATPDGGYQLTVPAAAEHVSTVRLFVGAVARLCGFDQTTVDDVKLSSSELASAVVASGISPTVIVTAFPGSGVLELRLEPWRDGMGEEEDFGALEIVTALFPRTSPRDGSVVIEIDSSDGHD